MKTEIGVFARQWQDLWTTEIFVNGKSVKIIHEGKVPYMEAALDWLLDNKYVSGFGSLTDMRARDIIRLTHHSFKVKLKRDLKEI